MPMFNLYMLKRKGAIEPMWIVALLFLTGLVSTGYAVSHRMKQVHDQALLKAQHSPSILLARE